MKKYLLAHKKILFWGILGLVVLIFAVICLILSADIRSTSSKGTSLHQDCEDVVAEPELPDIVYYVHGYKMQSVPKESDFSWEKVRLSKAFPEGEIRIRVWDSTGEFDTVRRQSENIGKNLALKISRMTEKERQRIVLVGHSLGARAVIYAMSELANKKMKIRRGIFLGAAIDKNDSHIPKALQASLKTSINLYNPSDYVLRKYYPLGSSYGETPLGITSYGGELKENVFQQNVKSEFTDEKSHNAVEYMKYLTEETIQAANESVSLLQKKNKR